MRRRSSPSQYRYLAPEGNPLPMPAEPSPDLADVGKAGTGVSGTSTVPPARPFVDLRGIRDLTGAVAVPGGSARRCLPGCPS